MSKIQVGINSVFLSALILFIAIPVVQSASENRVWQVYMALQEQSAGGVNYYEITNGETVVKQFPASQIIRVHATAGWWDLISVPINSLRPDGWSLDQTAEWLEANADGFLAFDLGMMSVYERIGREIKGRAFDYATVLANVEQFKWRSKDGTDYYWSSGTRSDYLADENRTGIVIQSPEVRRATIP